MFNLFGKKEAVKKDDVEEKEYEEAMIKHHNEQIGEEEQEYVEGKSK